MFEYKSLNLIAYLRTIDKMTIDISIKPYVMNNYQDQVSQMLT